MSMSLEAKIQEDLKEAMKAKDTSKVTILRMVKSAMENAKIAKKKDSLDDGEALSLIQKQAKQCQESITGFEKGRRTEQAENEKKQLAILKSYLPEQLSPEALEKIVKEVIAEVGASSKADTGKVMKAIMPKVKGKTDGKAVNAAVAKLLG